MNVGLIDTLHNNPNSASEYSLSAGGHIDCPMPSTKKNCEKPLKWMKELWKVKIF